MSATELVESLVRLLDARGIDRVDVFGHELGAAVAHQLVRRYPDRVDRLALSGWGLLRPLRWWSLRARLWTAARLPMRPPGDRFSHAHHAARTPSTEPPARSLEQLISRALERRGRDQALTELKLLLELSRSSALTVQQPVDLVGRVLLLFANDDPWFDRPEQESLAASYPGAAVLRFVWAGNVLGLMPAPWLEHKLELYFRPRSRPSASATRGR